MDIYFVFPQIGWWLLRFWLLIAIGSVVSPLILFLPSLLMAKNGKKVTLTSFVVLVVGGVGLAGVMLWLLLFQPLLRESVAWFTLATALAFTLLPLWEYVVRKKSWAVAVMTILTIVIVVLVVVAVITALPLL